MTLNLGETSLSSPQRPRTRRRGVATSLAGLVGIALLLAGCAAPHRANPRHFSSPDEAATSLRTTLEPYDEARVTAILGAGAKAILSSGDAVADAAARANFVAMYDERHRIAVEGDGTATILVGADEWPLPIPIVERDGAWQFDAERGAEEILARRIGRNELSAIETCRAIVDAQREYAAGRHGSDAGEYAARFLSEPGTRNGLYWEAADGEPTSPLGPLVAEAESENYDASAARNDAGPRPYHGYIYRILTAQGSSAPGGAMDYRADGKLTRGFALLAYPGSYDNSGIMTFLTNHNGVVYQCDLGADTAALAPAIAAFDPDTNWSVVR